MSIVDERGKEADTMTRAAAAGDRARLFCPCPHRPQRRRRFLLDPNTLNCILTRRCIIAVGSELKASEQRPLEVEPETTGSTRCGGSDLLQSSSLTHSRQQPW